VETPLISPTTNAKLQEDMVIAIETPYYELGFGAFNPEDTVRVTKSGFEKLSKMENKLYCL
jgi:Xaa-Pro aminopeptidase